MKKWIIPIICVVCAIFLLITTIASHQGVVYTSIGSTYNEFWFIPAKNAHFNITFRSPYTGRLTLIDEKGNALSNEKYTIYVDGKRVGQSFNVKNARKTHVAIRCSKALSPGKQYIRVKGGGPLVTHVYFQHHLNPLVVWLSWILSIFSAIALAWFLVFRRVFYPQFRSVQKVFYVPNHQPLVVKMTGTRLVVISAEKRSQSFWDALIKGPVIYKAHPAFTTPVTLAPARGGKVLVKGDSTIYRILPNPMPAIGGATIDNLESNIHITIN